MKRLGLAMAAATMLIAGCATTTDTDTLAGSVSYRERIALPQGAVVKVALQDTSRQDAAAETLSQVSFEADGAPPYPFELNYNASAMKPGHSYTLSARIEDPQGKLLFINTSVHNAFNGDGTDMMLQMVTHSGNGPLSLRDSQWTLTHLDGEPAPLGMQDKPATLMINKDGVAAGFSGCNRFHGQYLDSEGKLGPGPMAATMMACPTGMDLERDYLGHLSRATGYEIKGGALSLLNQQGDELLRFKPL